MRRLRVAAVVAGGVLAALAFGPLQNAGADVNRYVVQPNSPKPEVCNNHGTVPPGTWLQNKPCGYWIGTAVAGSSFDVHQTNPSGYHYGRSHGNNNICAWIPPGALSSEPTGTAPASCGEATKDRIVHRMAIGRDFNAPPHQATDGSPITVDPNCGGGAYANYYTSSDYDTGALRDPVGVPSAEVRYRFTTYGENPAIVIRDPNPAIGWAFMDRDCVTDWRDVVFDNADD